MKYAAISACGLITEGLNLLAAIISESLLQPGDEIVLTEAEHHANIVPWQFAAKKTSAAIDYLNGIGCEAIEQYETELLDYALEGIRGVNGLRVIGMPRDRGGVISLVMDGIPDQEVGKMLDAEGIAVRVGCHCAQPILARFGLESSVRPSFAFYNTRAEADVLVETLRRISRRR